MSDADIRFDGRVAIVTGAGNGLGRSHALLLAARGAKIVVNDPGATLDGGGATHSAADKVVEEIRAAGGEAVADYGSVAARDEAAAIVETALETYGGVDILINNAGILRDKTFRKMDLDDYEQVLAVHLLGSVYVTKAAFPAMADKGYGRVVLTTSSAGLYGNFGQTNYASAKMALIGFMNALKEEGKKFGVLVNTIAPVAFTRMGETIFPPELEAVIKPDYVSAAVAYLCAEACTATGAIVAAGGGYYAGVRVVEAPGHRFPKGAPVSPEDIAENFNKIMDLEGAAPFENAGEAGLKLFASE